MTDDLDLISLLGGMPDETPDILPTPEIVDRAQFTQKQLDRCLEHFKSVDILAGKLEQDPYCLMDVPTFGWSRTDKIATQRLDITLDDVRRLAASVKGAINAYHNGDCYFSSEQLLAMVSQLTRIPWSVASTHVGLAVEKGILHEDEEGHFWLKKSWNDEIVISEFAHKNCDAGTQANNVIEHATDNGLSILTGSAGTGKTTLIKEIIESPNFYSPYILTALTGKAARRLSEKTGRRARTLHSLLWTIYARENSDSEESEAWISALYGNHIFVDEASMLDLELAAWLFREAEKYDLSITLIGDDNQLEPVGAGQVFYDLIASGEVPVWRLTINHRSGDIPGLVAAGQTVLNGEIPANSQPDFVILSQYSDNVVSYTVDLLSEMQKKNHPWKDATVISWQKDYVAELNRRLQELKNPYGRQWAETWSGGANKGEVKRILKVGDPVVHKVNDRKRGLVNGDVGVITNILMQGRNAAIVTVQYTTVEGTKLESKYNSLESFETDDIDLAYCFTVHKFQGSESDRVFFVLPYANGYTQRSLVYTAVTRGVKNVAVVCDPKALRTAVSNDYRGQRQTKLKEKIQER